MISTPRFFRALGDQTRMRIVNLLTRGRLCVCDIQYVLQQPQSSISRHLALLRSADLVADRRDGMRTFYELTEWQPGVARGVLEALQRELRFEPDYGRDLDRLAALKASGECHQVGSENVPRRQTSPVRSRLRMPASRRKNARPVSTTRAGR